MLQLWQTEWCPASRRVRQRLTELGVDYISRQVPVEQELRHELRRATGATLIPVLVCETGEVVAGEDAILRRLEEHMREPNGAGAHRLKAAKARRRYLEEECECPPQPVTP